MLTSRIRYLITISALLLSVGVGAGVPASLVYASLCSGSGTVTCTFAYTGAEVQFPVPTGVTTVTVSAVGGAGGAGGGFAPGGSPGGRGGTVTATLTVTPGATLYVDVGGNGTTENCNGLFGDGGFNGGGNNDGNDSGIYGDCGGGTGGGASGVYSTSNIGLGGTPLVVAGGGGGGGHGGNGGFGGVEGAVFQNGGHGGDCTDTIDGGVGAGGSGGTQTSGGTGGDGANGGTSGVHGNPNLGGDSVGVSGAGGGGYWGGGGGGDDRDGCGGGGGAGSSFADSTLTSNAVFGSDATSTPQITINYASPTSAPYARLRMSTSGGWTYLRWIATERVAGFNVYKGPVKLNRHLITSRNRQYRFRVHGPMRHLRLEAIPLR